MQPLTRSASERTKRRERRIGDFLIVNSCVFPVPEYGKGKVWVNGEAFAELVEISQNPEVSAMGQGGKEAEAVLESKREWLLFSN